MIQVKREITNFLQKIGESFAQAWERFSRLVNLAPNHGFKEYAVIQYFYHGLIDESKQMIDLTAGGSLSELTVKQCNDLISIRASNDEQYNSNEDTEYKNGMLRITHGLMPEVKKSMEEKCISTELLKDNKVYVL